SGAANFGGSGGSNFFSGGSDSSSGGLRPDRRRGLATRHGTRVIDQAGTVARQGHAHNFAPLRNRLAPRALVQPASRVTHAQQNVINAASHPQDDVTAVVLLDRKVAAMDAAQLLAFPNFGAQQPIVTINANLFNSGSQTGNTGSGSNGLVATN